MIKNLKIIQRPKIIKNYFKKSIKLKNEDKKYIENTAKNIKDKSLKYSLENLGKSIFLKKY